MPRAERLLQLGGAALVFSAAFFCQLILAWFRSPGKDGHTLRRAVLVG